MEPEGGLSSSVQATAGPAFLGNANIRAWNNSSDEDKGLRTQPHHQVSVLLTRLCPEDLGSSGKPQGT